MKKTYTRKQITEAIAYWKKQLKKLNESIDFNSARAKLIKLLDRHNPDDFEEYGDLFEITCNLPELTHFLDKEQVEDVEKNDSDGYLLNYTGQELYYDIAYELFDSRKNKTTFDQFLNNIQNNNGYAFDIMFNGKTDGQVNFQHPAISSEDKKKLFELYRIVYDWYNGKGYDESDYTIQYEYISTAQTTIKSTSEEQAQKDFIRNFESMHHDSKLYHILDIKRI